MIACRTETTSCIPLQLFPRLRSGDGPVLGDAQNTGVMRGTWATKPAPGSREAFEVGDDEDLAALADEWIAITVRRNHETGDLRNVPPSEMDQFNEPVHALIDLLISTPDKACRVVEHVLSKTSDPWVLANLGAGPLEDLLVDGEDDVITWVTALPQRFANAREALAHVWLGGLAPQSQAAVRKLIQIEGR
jgi:hypothetical protein